MGLMLIMMMIVITVTACNPPSRTPHRWTSWKCWQALGTHASCCCDPGPALTLDSAALHGLAAAFYTKLPISIWMGSDLLSVDYGEKSSENLGLVAGLLGMLMD